MRLFDKIPHSISEVRGFVKFVHKSCDLLLFIQVNVFQLFLNAKIMSNFPLKTEISENFEM